ncbi:hypothetical protein HMPREF1869_01347 [Bacteroidales bacterium KA00251]|nr:hypothetical protein HMPREF1869_01347 [Bacteroidales bacterium KA00251]
MITDVFPKVLKTFMKISLTFFLQISFFFSSYRLVGWRSTNAFQSDSLAIRNKIAYATSTRCLMLYFYLFHKKSLDL